MMEGVNLTKMYCKHFCNCHTVPQYNNNMVINSYHKNKTSGQGWLPTTPGWNRSGFCYYSRVIRASKGTVLQDNMGRRDEFKMSDAIARQPLASVAIGAVVLAFVAMTFLAAGAGGSKSCPIT
jgi:hypothetical protein